jgi:hypothetical protein
MIEIDGKRLFHDKNNGLKRIETMYEDAWKYLKTKYSLDGHGYIKLRLHDKYKRKVLISNEDGSEDVTAIRWPAGIGVNIATTIYIDGTPLVVRWYERKSNGAREGEYIYDPSGLVLSKDRMLRENDKDLILFLFLFSGDVDTKWSKLIHKLDEKNKTNKLYFEDKVADAKVRVATRTKVAYATVALDKLDDMAIRRFAGIINVDNAETDSVFMLTEAIISNVEKDSSNTYDLLLEFVDKMDDSIYGIDEKVRKASRKKLVGWERAKSSKGDPLIIWSFKEKGVKTEEIYSFIGTATRLDNLIEYYAANPEAYETFLEKYQEQ